MLDAIEYYRIQSHSWQEHARVVVGLFLPLIIMVLWVVIFRHRKNDEYNRSIPWRDEK